MKKVRLKRVEIADSVFSRATGLMFRRKINRPLIFTFPFPARHALHSFFVFFQFDAVFLDDCKKVVEVRERIAPFTPLVLPKTPVKYVVELPAGEAKRKRLRRGMRVSW